MFSNLARVCKNMQKYFRINILKLYKNLGNLQHGNIKLRHSIISLKFELALTPLHSHFAGESKRVSG